MLRCIVKSALFYVYKYIISNIFYKLVSYTLMELVILSELT